MLPPELAMPQSFVVVSVPMYLSMFSCYTPDGKMVLRFPPGDKHWIQRVKWNHTPDWFLCSQNSPSGIPSVAGWPIVLHGSDVQRSSFVLAFLFVIVTCLKLLLVIITSVLCVKAGWEQENGCDWSKHFQTSTSAKFWQRRLIFFPCLILF